MRPGIYKGGSPGGYGLWRRTPTGRWLFAMAVEGATWRRSRMTDEEAAAAPALTYLCP